MKSFARHAPVACAMISLLFSAPIIVHAVGRNSAHPSGNEERAGKVDALGMDDHRITTLHAANTELRIEVIGVEDAARIEMLQRWAQETARATVLPSGRFPLSHATVRINDISSHSDSPVPWGQTQRDDGVSVLLYVRKDATYEELHADWTAVHEFAHLRHPYLGDSGRWLAEGLASYDQNMLRGRAGLLDPNDAWTRLDAGFRRGEAVGEGARMDEMGKHRGGTMRVYWVGAAYWLEADVALHRMHDTTLETVLDRYAECCLNGEAWVKPQDFLAELDRLARAQVFVPLYARYAQMRGFPSLDASYGALGIKRDGPALKFSDGDETARLRRTMMSSVIPEQHHE